MEENLKQLPGGASDIIKIAIYGPESTGKTALAKQLAEHYDTVWAPEFAREYLQKKWDTEQKICEPDDLIPIAVGQTRLENELRQKAKKYIFSDTCLLVTKVYSEIYYGYCDPVLDKAARKHKYDLFFLTDIDVPWEKDDLRDRPEAREEIFADFKKALTENNKPFILLTGSAEERLAKAIEILEKLDQAKALGFISQDFVQIYKHGIALNKIERQLEIFRNGIAKQVLDRPAVPYDGIVKLQEDGFRKYAEYYDKYKDGLQIEKFIPASGAASRMFKFLSEFVNSFDPEEETINAYINRKKASALQVFLAGLEKFPFYETVRNCLEAQHPDFRSWDATRRHYFFIKTMLDSADFDYCNKPKGVLPFHKYDDHIATAVEEHLNETVYYASGSDGVSHLHFTVSENHRKLFEKIIEDVKPKIERQSGNTIHTTFSYQDKATDTIAVAFDDTPFRDDSGKLVFRPGGHGALIENLNKLQSDIIFIKNIDNVIQNHVETIALYKKALAGKLLEIQKAVFYYLKQIDSGEVTEEHIPQIVAFLRDTLNTEIIDDVAKFTPAHKIEYIASLLNRPIRVCGMVKNEGEPGGGPFWVRDRKGYLSLQIVESSQVDMENSAQEKIMKRSTHFNPVDLVCAIRNYKGEKFDLTKYVDHNSGFIVEKNKNGRPLKGYELPGLWNGAMEKWITIFVEVPLITFNPVKTVNDLLKSAHQP